MTFIRGISGGASAERLESLVRQRLEVGADKAGIDAKIWDLFGEEWAVMFTDLSGFSRQVAEFGIIHFLQTIFESQRLFVPVIEAHGGILIKQEGDSLLVVFRNVLNALECAFDMQRSTLEYNARHEPAEHVLLCVGLGYGRILKIGDEDVFGHEVNGASKLGEDVAMAGDVLLTKNAARLLQQDARWDLQVLPIGACDFPSEAYRVTEKSLA